MKIKDCLGKTFGRLTVIRFNKIGQKRNAFWNCQCECGNLTSVAGDKLRSGRTKSCGCLSYDLSSSRFTKHGQYGTGEYHSWAMMLQRCKNTNNPDYKNYGLRGIKVCRRWIKFSNFFADMGKKPTPKHSIERKNNDGNYDPDNCVWATKKEQSLNKRTARLVTFHGETKNVKTWASIVKIKRQTICRRLDSGWSSRKALTFPASKNGRIYKNENDRF